MLSGHLPYMLSYVLYDQRLGRWVVSEYTNTGQCPHCGHVIDYTNLKVYSRVADAIYRECIGCGAPLWILTSSSREYEVTPYDRAMGQGGGLSGDTSRRIPDGFYIEQTGGGYVADEGGRDDDA